MRPLFGPIFRSPLTTNRVRGPESGATFGTHFLVPKVVPHHSPYAATPARQAATFLQWAQAICGDACRRGAELVVVNLDETAVSRVVAHRRGHVVLRRCTEAGGASQYERISRKESHGHITVMGAVCSDAALQPLLTQWFLPKDAQLTRAEKTVLAAMDSVAVAARDQRVGQ